MKVYLLYKACSYFWQSVYVSLVYADKQKAQNECDRRNTQGDDEWYVASENFIE